MSTATFGEDELLDGFSAQQIFQHEDADGLTFDDIIALVRRIHFCTNCSSSALVALTLYV